MSSRVLLDSLKFVRERDCPEGPVCLQAAKMLEDKGRQVQWVWSDQVKPDKDSTLVMEDFNTTLYHQLNGKTSIIGPLVVIAHLSKNWPLPLTDQPVHNMTMHGITLCCTQTGARDKRTHILELTRLMGGRTTGNFTRKVTHLVAGQVGSTKYKVARSLQTPVLKVSWIEHCWERGQKELIHATDPNILVAHKCPPLSGCVITSTGFNVEERNTLQQQVDQNGAQYSKQLIRDTCTHLIVGTTTSQKYEFAQQWKILCVTPQWLYKSIERGYCQDEGEYPLEATNSIARRSSSNYSIEGRGHEEGKETTLSLSRNR